MYAQGWGVMGYGLMYGTCIPPTQAEDPQSHVPPSVSGGEVKQRDHAVNVTVKLPPGARPDVWQLVRKLLRYCGPSVENRTTPDSIRARFFSIAGALNCLDHLHRLRLHHSLPPLAARTDEKLAVELLEFRIMASALDPHNKHTREMVKASITRLVHEWQQQHQADYAQAVRNPTLAAPAKAEVLDADLMEGVEAAEEAIKAIQEIGELIDVEGTADVDKPESTAQVNRANRAPRSSNHGGREQVLAQERLLWEREMERREHEEEQQRAWEREKWRLRRAGLYSSDDEEFQRQVGYERALRELQRRGQDPLAAGNAPLVPRRTTARVSGDILKALNDAPLDIHGDGGAAPWLPSDEEPLEGSDGMESPPPPPPPPPTGSPKQLVPVPPDAPDSDDDWFARRRAERERGRRERAAQRQKETANEELRERIQRIQQRNRERLKLLGMMTEKPKLKPKHLLRKASIADTSSSDSQPRSDIDEDNKRLKRARRSQPEQVSHADASSDTSDDILRLKRRRQGERATCRRLPAKPPRTPSPARPVKAEPRSPSQWSSPSSPVTPPLPNIVKEESSPPTPLGSPSPAVVAVKLEQQDCTPVLRSVGRQATAKVATSLITPANVMRSFTLQKGGKLKQLRS
eukprot:GGOE01000577.1.p1 GENE.GGOE01000577.1~~GGOE01000577.1.p1  ORF type:complete len:633 (-),score=111.87 GGOE01000577.1:21-1919(-)